MQLALLRVEGGVLSAQQFAEHLGITPQDLGKKHNRNRVFWLEIGDGYGYPAFQVGPSGLLPGIREVLDAFPGGRSVGARELHAHGGLPSRRASAHRCAPRRRCGISDADGPRPG
jgi:hypothetical protein